MTAFVRCAALVVSLAGCSGSDEPGGPARPTDDTGASECLTDLSTPTATYELEDLDEDAPGPTKYLTADAAVVQFRDVPHVLGDNPALQDALDRTQLRAATVGGLLVVVAVDADITLEDLEDPTAPERFAAVVDGRGRTVVGGPRMGPTDTARAVGDQIVVVGPERDLTTYDVTTGQESEPGPAIAGDGLTYPGISSSIVLTDEGDGGGLIDARTGRTFGLDDLLGDGVTDITVAGTGEDRVLLRGELDERTSRLWTWSSTDGIREVYTTHDDDTVGDRASSGVCGNLLYLVEDDELKVVDTADDDAVVGRRPLPVDLDDGQGYDVLAVPGGVLVEVDEGSGARRYSWFDGGA